MTTPTLATGDTSMVTINLEVVLCASCSIPFGVTVDIITRRRADGKTFYCPSGHQNTYPQTKKAQDAYRTLPTLDRQKRIYTYVRNASTPVEADLIAAELKLPLSLVEKDLAHLSTTRGGLIRYRGSNRPDTYRPPPKANPANAGKSVSARTLELLAKQEKPIHYADIATTIGAVKGTVNVALSKLHSKGKVTRTAPGTYKMSP